MKKAISTVNMSHEEWLNSRNQGIGGSDVATILGLNQYKSAFQLWLEKIGELPVKQAESEAAYWGTELEEVVAREFTLRTNKKVRWRNKVFEHATYPFLRGTIDRDVVGERAVLECKTANAFLTKDWLDDEIPAAYICQVQHYINILNYDYAYIAVLIGGQKFIWKRLDRDQELIDLLTKKCVEFWEVNVLQKIAPPVDGSEAANTFLKEYYHDIETKETTLSAEFDSYIESRRKLKVAEKEVKMALKEIENNLILGLGQKDANVGITPHNIITFKIQARTSLNKKLLEEKYPEVAKDKAIYKTSETRVLKDKEI